MTKKDVNTAAQSIRWGNCLTQALEENEVYRSLTKKEKIAIKDKLTDLNVKKGHHSVEKYIKEDLKELVKFDEISERAKEIETIKFTDDHLKQNQGAFFNGFIFDPALVLRKRPFTFFKLKDNVAGLGLLLPKEKEIYDKKTNKLLGKKQVLQPAVITSDHRLLEVDYGFEQKHRISFESHPVEMEIRWSLDKIARFLHTKDKIKPIDLYNKIRNQYMRYCGYKNHTWYSIHALWDMVTYFFLLFKAFPIFELRGHMSTGKTRTMIISSFMTFNASDILINPSEAMLFRETHDKRICKYIDEAEKLFKMERGQLVPDQRVDVINSSYFHKGCVPRIEKVGNSFKTIYYKTYSPTMVGSINGLYGSTEDRAIVQIAVKLRGFNKEPDESDRVWQQIRDDCYLFLLQDWHKIEKQYNDFDNDSKLKDRDFQIWLPIFTLAKFLDPKIYEDVKKFAEHASEYKEDKIEQGTVDYKILKGAFVLLQEGDGCSFAVKDIRSRFFDDIKPHPKTITRKLDKFGLKDYKHRFTEGMGYQILKSEFTDLIRHYVYMPEFETLSSLTEVGKAKEEKIEDEIQQSIIGAEREKILSFLEKQGGPVDIGVIESELGVTIELAMIDYMKKSLEIFEPKPGRISLLR